VMSHRLFVSSPEILLHPNIPKPLHGVTPRSILGKKWWDKTRKEAYESTAFRCKSCGVWKLDAKGRKWLEGHEQYDIDYAKGTATYLETVPLCHYCHNYIHDGRLSSLLQIGEVHQSKYVAIIQHGDDVLWKAKLTRPSQKDREEGMTKMLINGLVAPWQDWRLHLFGKEYPPKFKSEAQWKKVVGGN